MADLVPGSGAAVSQSVILTRRVQAPKKRRHPGLWPKIRPLFSEKWFHETPFVSDKMLQNFPFLMISYAESQGFLVKSWFISSM